MIESWGAIVEDLGPRLYRYFRASFTTVDAEDLVQQTLLKLVEKVSEGRFDPLRGNLRMFAFGIAHFVRLEHRRRIVVVEDSSDEPAALSSPEDEVETRRLRRAISRLEEAQRQVVTLMIDRDLTLNEIALILQMPENTVKSHVHRAKAALRTLLGKA